MGTALSFKDVNKTYDSKQYVLKEVSFEIKIGDFFGLLGLNGAGKSTAIRIGSTLIPPTSGQIGLFELENIFSDPCRAKSFLGVMPQEINLSHFETVESHLRLQAAAQGISWSKIRTWAEFLLSSVGLPGILGIRADRLSGGMKRRTMLVRALLHRPRLLILDEPTAGVDIEAREAIWALLKRFNRQEGMTILMTTHYLEEVDQLCSDLLVLEQGKVHIVGNYDELIRQAPYQIFLAVVAPPVPNWEFPFPLLEVKATGEFLFKVSREFPFWAICDQFRNKGWKLIRLQVWKNSIEQFLKRLPRSFHQNGTI